ncbi:MAG: NifU family protein [Mycobacteriales bacterium]
MGPSIAAGMGPSIAAGMGPSIAAGMGPSIAAGMGPSIAPGMGPSIAPGIEPGIDPGIEPSIDPGIEQMAELDQLLSRLEQLLEEVESWPEPLRGQTFEILDDVDGLHRLAITRLADALGEPARRQLVESDPAIGWLFEAYGVGLDERAAVEQALANVLPYIASHGGQLELRGVDRGVVRVAMSGACAGCSASAITLQQGVEQALRDGFPSFVALEVEETQAPSHEPPGPTLLQIQPRPA